MLYSRECVLAHDTHAVARLSWSSPTMTIMTSSPLVLEALLWPSPSVWERVGSPHLIEEALPSGS